MSGVAALDLEWVPDTDGDEDRQTRVALLQLSSATVVLLVRLVGVLHMPPLLLAFLTCAPCPPHLCGSKARVSLRLSQFKRSELSLCAVSWCGSWACFICCRRCCPSSSALLS